MQGMQQIQKQEDVLVSDVERTMTENLGIENNRSCTKELRKREIKIFLENFMKN